MSSPAQLPDRILVPVEHQDLAIPCLDALSDLIDDWRPNLLLLNVWEPLPFTPPEASFYESGHLTTYQDAAAERGQVMLQTAAERAKALGMDVVERIVLPGYPSEVIREVATEKGVGWIVMTAHQRHGLSRWFLGSVCEKVAASAPCPVLTVPVHV